MKIRCPQCSKTLANEINGYFVIVSTNKHRSERTKTEVAAHKMFVTCSCNWSGLLINWDTTHTNISVMPT